MLSPETEVAPVSTNFGIDSAVLVEQWRREYNTVRPHSACGGFPPAPEAIKPSPWFLRMPVLHGPPQVLGLT